MITTAIALIAGVVAAIIGFFLGKGGIEKTMSNQIANAQTQSNQLLSQAKIDIEALRKDRELAAKEQALQFKTNAEHEILQRQKSIEDFERKVRQKENSVNQKNNNLKTKEKEVLKLQDSLTKEIDGIDKKRGDFERKKTEFEAKRKKFDLETNKIKDRETGLKKQEENIKKQEESVKKKELKMIEEVEAKREKIETALREKEEAIENEVNSKLEAVSGLSQEDAKAQLIEAMTKKAETQAMAHVKTIVDEAKQRAGREAKKIIIQTIQRTAAEQAIENAVTVFNLESDDIKGQIIGREGRNIRALEAATGIEIIVDDTPEAVVISGYDPFRREVARLSLKRLVADGRIHPARIEEIVNKTRKQLEQEVIEIGERTVIELNIHGLHPKLIQLVGKMRFRSSYGQNLLQHSKETANICAIMAAELGLTKKSIRMAMRAGLLHDIGKVSDENPELSHALLGMELTQKYNEKDPIVNAVGAHHDEVEMTHMISPIVQAADAISGSRPGARREILETYLQRIRDLEDLAASYEGVQKAYAIQAGRELRVIVESDQVSDKRIEELSFEISQKIQSEMQYPGQIKVTVIREKRAITFAK